MQSFCQNSIIVKQIIKNIEVKILDQLGDVVQFQNVYNNGYILTITMPNFLNGIIHLIFLTLSIIIFRDIKMKT